ncbi:MAG: glycosyltransferase family 39 protein [Promethearchaeota archaeon]|nr:MAG: glycosyltransferase family 39 protein [Candidatus Lokiarchaeota archaeon]
MKIKINLQSLKSPYIKLILLLAISFLLSLIRPILLILGYSIADMPDAVHYATIVESFRGNANLFDVPSAWRIRILVPLIASIIPGDAYMSLNIVSLIFNLLAVFFFYQFLSFFQITPKQQFLGTLIYIFTAPTIVLGFTPLTDSASMFFTIFSLYLYGKLNEKPSRNNLKIYIMIGLIIGLGVLARETVIFVIPVIVLWRIIDERIQWKLLFQFIIGIGLIPVIIYLILIIFIGPLTISGISLSRIISNFGDLFDERTLATIAQLTFLLLIGVYGNYFQIVKKSKIMWKLILGMACFLIPFIYAFLFADMSFRFFWAFFIFAIPFFILSIDKLSSKTDQEQ